ncbi:MAG: hypothetical protein ABS908_12485, partial [Enterococcus casseliflavus]
VDENCYLSKELKVQIALELAKNTTRKEIANRYFVSDLTVLSVLQLSKFLHLSSENSPQSRLDLQVK